jgi:hypothetical protein
MLIAFGFLVFIGGLGLLIGSARPIMFHEPSPPAIVLLLAMAVTFLVVRGILLHFST